MHLLKAPTLHLWPDQCHSLPDWHGSRGKHYFCYILRQSQPISFTRLPQILVLLPDQGIIGELLGDFPVITESPLVPDSLSHCHPGPVNSQCHCLAPDNLQAAKVESHHILNLGFIWPSSSMWSLPLHRVWKNGDKCPCDDYHHFNTTTKPNRYLFPHIQAFSQNLAGCSIFSCTDLVRDYHCWGEHPEDNCHNTDALWS